MYQKIVSQATVHLQFPMVMSIINWSLSRTTISYVVFQAKNGSGDHLKFQDNAFDGLTSFLNCCFSVSIKKFSR